ncbi:MAG: biotin transporter BioY [Eubacteriales bacterium]|nr:biotin transporter BioY [Eubacteriales bacterium]
MRANFSKELVFAAVAAALIAVGAWLKIPTPYIAITLQLPIIVILALILGPRTTARACLIYLIMGLIGIPVFAGGGGPHYLLLPSFGYIYGFCLANFLAAKAKLWQPNSSFKRDLSLALFITTIVYLSGLSHFYLINMFYLDNPLTLNQVITIGLLKTIIKDVAFAPLLVLAVKTIRQAAKNLIGANLDRSVA